MKLLRSLARRRLVAAEAGHFEEGSMGRVKRIAAGHLITLFCLASTLSYAQVDSGSLAGTVADTTASVIVGAQVVATEQQSGTVYKTVTSSSGTYVFASLRPGTYNVNVSAPSFSSAQVSAISIFVGTRSSQDFKLAIGSATETVNVTANGPSLDTESSDVGTVLTSRQVEDLPLAVGGAFRSLQALSFLSPGAVGPGTNGGTFQSKIAGGQTLGSEYLIDGISTYRSENGSGNVDQTTPSVESIEEFRVETSSLPADYGRTTGGIANFKTRSGTNKYHGQVYDFYKNLALDANNWFNNYQISQLPDNSSRNPFQRGLDTKNDFGANLGGPISIPHFYNGRDRTFFFFNFEQLRFQSGGVAQSLLPTAAQRSGDFSSFLGPLTTTINPCTGLPLQNGQLFDPLAPTQNIGGVICRTATFQTGANTQVIPTGRFSPLALKILALLPLPTPGFVANGFNYAQAFTNQQANTDFSLRVDQNLGTRHHIFAFASARENSTGNNSILPGPIDSGGNITDQYYKFGRAGWDFTITPHLLNSLSIGGNRVNSFNSSAASLNGISYDSQLGIPNSANANTTFPSISFGEPLVPGLGNSNNDDNVDNGIIGNDAVSWTLGAHSIRIGATYRWQQFSYNNNGTASGYFNFGRGQTSGSSNSGNITGNGIASFLLGAPGDIGRTIQLHAPRWLSHYYAGYVQDDWKLRRNLTLNLGLRYSIDTPRYEAEGFSSNFDPTLANPGAGGLLGALAFAGMNGHPKNEAWADTYYKNFEPRVGFSYSPGWLNDKVAVRGAYTIISGPLEYADYGQGLSAGFTQGHDHNSFTILPVSSFDAGFPASDVYAVNTDITQRNGTQIDAVQRGDGRPATIQNWSLETQTQLAPDLIFTLGYIGQHSVRLHSYDYEQNDMPLSGFALGDLLGAPVNSPQAVAAGIKVPYPGFNGNVGQALRPYPQFDFMSSDNFLQNRGQATYNAMEVKLERRFRDGLNLLASYTWSKTMTDADSIQPFFATLLGQGGTQNPYNLKAEKAVSNQDVPNNFVVSYLYELPVGHGKRFMGHAPKAVDAVIGGWRIGGIQRYLSGQPVSFFGLATGPPSGFYFGIRPDRVAGQSLLTPVGASGKYDPHNLSQSIFNRAAFADPNNPAIRKGGPFRFGNMSRNVTEYRTPASLNEDLNVNKSFVIREALTVDFRVEMFNAFNRHIFNKPDTGITDPNFGQINSTLNGPRNMQSVLKIHY
jgi:Carboxypeptidase regulatory-like domain